MNLELCFIFLHQLLLLATTLLTITRCCRLAYFFRHSPYCSSSSYSSVATFTRLDSEKRRNPYDLIWEDVELLAGKSFYLPGSIDVNEKQMEQWNNTPPPLYLWSRQDWTTKHKNIAQRQRHIPNVQGPPQSNEKTPESDLATVNNEISKDLTTTLDAPMKAW